MRSLLFKLVLVLVIMLPVSVYADTPSLDGETLFNETVEKAVSGQLSLNPVNILNMVTDDLMREVRECAGDVTILFIIAAISGIITAVSNSMGNKSTGEAAFFACFTSPYQSADRAR